MKYDFRWMRRRRLAESPMFGCQGFVPSSLGRGFREVRYFWMQGPLACRGMGLARMSDEGLTSFHVIGRLGRPAKQMINVCLSDCCNKSWLWLGDFFKVDHAKFRSEATFLKLADRVFPQ